MEYRELEFNSGLSSEAAPQPETVERLVSSAECEGHFKVGAKILPAFRMLGQFIDKLASQGETPRSVKMIIGDILPEGVRYTASSESPDSLTLTRQREIVITGSPTLLQLVDQSELWGTGDIPLDNEQILLDSAAIQEIIPQGRNIQFIDAVITPDPSNPKTLAEAVHTITLEDYEQVGIRDYFYFDRSRMLEGLGQLAYIHFQKTEQSDRAIIPYFTEVTGHFNTDYQPKVGEQIHYLLTHFEVETNNHGDQASGTIAGMVLTHNGTRVLANFVAKAGVIKPDRLEKLVNLAQRQSSKPIQPNQN